MSNDSLFVSKQEHDRQQAQTMGEFRASILRHLLDGGLISLATFSALPDDMRESIWKAVRAIESLSGDKYVVIPTSADGEPLACSHELVSIWLERLDA